MAPWGHMYVNPGLTEPFILCLSFLTLALCFKNNSRVLRGVRIKLFRRWTMFLIALLGTYNSMF